MWLNKKDSSTLHWQYLNDLYQTEVNPHFCEPNTTVPQTNGEILYPSIDKLLSTVPLTEQDVFLDLGSGRGKVVIQAFLTSPVKAACGIEFLPALHQQALLAADKIAANYDTSARQLTFLLGNFLTMPLPYATVVLINSTCFSQSMLDALGRIINQIPSIHTVFTSRPINTLQRLSFKKTFYIECSWDTALCYVYL